MKKYRTHARMRAQPNDYNCRIHPVIKYESPAINTHLGGCSFALTLSPFFSVLYIRGKSLGNWWSIKNFGVARKIYYLIKCCRFKNEWKRASARIHTP